MLRNVFANPLLIRELVSGARQPTKAHVAYPGLAWSFMLNALVIALFILWGDRNDVFSSCRYFVLAAWLQTWLLWRRSGAYVASSLADSEEKAALSVISVSRYGLGQALLAKLGGALSPLALETVLVTIPVATVFTFWGCTPWVLVIAVILFQIAMTLCGAGVGLAFGWSQSDGVVSATLYRKFASFIGILGVAMCWSTGLGKVALVVAMLYFLLILLPALNEKLGFYAGVLAIVSMLLMPLVLTLDNVSIYSIAKSANPFVTLWQVHPQDFSADRIIYLSEFAQDSNFHAFANDCYRQITGAEKLTNAPNWTDQLSYLLRDRRVAAFITNEYFSWRLSRLLIEALAALAVFGACLSGVVVRIRRVMSDR